MSNYPGGYPDNRVIVGDSDLTMDFQMILIDGFVLEPPEPKTYYIDIPGGNGVIDLTESLGGDVAYKNRHQTFTFKLIYPKMFENIKTKLSNFLHGKYFNYRLTWDPGYTYKGRFTVESYSHVALAAGKLGEIVISVDADPYKYKPNQVFRINGVGGEEFLFNSGRKPVRPVIETTRSTIISWEGNTFRVGTGTFRLNDVLFHEGINRLYINTYEIFSTTWNDIGRSGEYTLTWNEAKKYTFDKLQMLNIKSKKPNEFGTSTIATTNDTSRLNFFAQAYRWSELRNNPTYTWDYLKNNRWTWVGVNYNPSAPGMEGILSGDGSGAAAIITYEWGDL